MNKNLPRTPFSTPLSRSARETKRRLEHIMSGPKKRPPMIFIVLVSAFCLLSGNLVSCQMAQPEEGAPERLEYVQSGSASLEDREHEPAWVTYMHGETPLSEGEQRLRENLFRAAERQNGYQFQTPVAQLMSYVQKDGWVLGAVFVEDHLENTLILGIMDKETGEVPHGVFQCSVHGGIPNVVTFQGQDGEFRLLYTFNGQENGQYDGEAGVVRFDGEHMTWQWPVEGDVRYGKEPSGAAPAAYGEYREYWDSGHLALLAPGGVDIYTVNPDFVWGKEDPWSMWQLDHGETFYSDPSSAEELPMPVYFQSLRWLNEATNDPGGWRITSLILNEEKCGPENQIDCYTLRAEEEFGTGELTADLYFPYVQEGRRRSYDSLDHAAYSNGEDLPAHNEQNSAPVSGQPVKPEQKDEDWNWDWADKWTEEWEREQEAKQAAEYQSAGVTIDGKDYYYQGQLVNIFLDQRPDKSVYTLDQNPAGTVNVKILRDQDGKITGAAYLTDAETAELADLFEN